MNGAWQFANCGTSESRKQFHESGSFGREDLLDNE
jgi:hypothetical protein